MDIRSKIASLGLPEGSFIVVGSGILQALHIRESNDIDIAVSQDIYDQLSQTPGWTKVQSLEQVVLKKDVFDICTSWSGRDVKTLLNAAVYIEDIPYLNLDDLRVWKAHMQRPKDLVDVELIDKYEAGL